MNCYNHPEDVSVASCVDCGKGLCKTCTGLYQIPICNECNLKRVGNDKGNLLKVYFSSIVLFILGIVFGVVAAGSFILGICFGYWFAGVPWGWKAITFIQPRMFLFLSFFGWMVYFLLKFSIASFVGMVVLPISIVKLIVDLASAKKKEQNIKNNLS